jgi:tetratricopeptide (TPR) repeat protein
VSVYAQQHPESAAAHKLLGMNLYMLGRPVRDALGEMRKATELAPRDADAFYYLGRLYFSADNAPMALQAYEKTVELDPAHLKGYTQMGQTLEVLGRFDAAAKAYRAAIEIEQKQPRKSEWPYYDLGLLCWNNGRKEEAVRYFREALERNPRFSEAKIKLAVALSTPKPTDEAHRLLEEVVRDDAANAEGHYRYALLLSKEGKKDEAAKHFALFEKYRKP